MADILRFPNRTRLAPDHLDEEDDNWTDDSATGSVSLRLVAALAAAPSRTLAEVAHKVEILVLRLAPTDGTDGSLCDAEAALLRSVSREIRRVAEDATFATQIVSLSAPAMAE
jgi:hypothetical protein